MMTQNGRGPETVVVGRSPDMDSVVAMLAECEKRIGRIQDAIDRSLGEVDRRLEATANAVIALESKFSNLDGIALGIQRDVAALKEAGGTGGQAKLREPRRPRLPDPELVAEADLDPGLVMGSDQWLKYDGPHRSIFTTTSSLAAMAYRILDLNGLRAGKKTLAGNKGQRRLFTVADMRLYRDYIVEFGPDASAKGFLVYARMRGRS